MPNKEQLIRQVEAVLKKKNGENSYWQHQVIVQAFGGTPDSTMFFTPIIMMILGFITLKFYKNAKA